MDLVLGAIEVEVLARLKVEVLQSVCRELGELVDLELGYSFFGQIAGEPADDEDVIGRGERRACEEEAAVRENLDALRSSAVCQCGGCLLFLAEVGSGGRFSRRSWDGDSEHFDPGVVTCRQIQRLTVG